MSEEKMEGGAGFRNMDRKQSSFRKLQRAMSRVMIDAKEQVDFDAIKPILFCIFLPFTALVLGAVAMSKFEYSKEIERKETYDSLYEDLLNVTREIEATYNHSSIVEKLESFVTEIQPYLTGKSSVPTDDDPFWNIEGAAFFCWTIMTTIGYGSYTPYSDAGKVFVVFYAIVTVPLFLVSLAVLSASLARGAKAVAAHLHKDYDGFVHGKYYAFGMVLLSLLYIFGLAIPFSVLHGWSYLDGVYFSLISLTTIGLGDFTPTLDEKQIFGFILYSILGLLLIGAGVSSVQHVYEEWGDRVSKKAHEILPRNVSTSILLGKQGFRVSREPTQTSAGRRTMSSDKIEWDKRVSREPTQTSAGRTMSYDKIEWDKPSAATGGEH